MARTLIESAAFSAGTQRIFGTHERADELQQAIYFALSNAAEEGVPLSADGRVRMIQSRPIRGVPHVVIVYTIDNADTCTLHEISEVGEDQ